MTNRTPLEVVQRIYEAFATQDLDLIVELAHPDIVITQDPALPWGGTHVGIDGVGTFALALTGAIDSAVTVEALFAAGEQVVQYGRTSGTVRANGAAFDIPECHVWTVREGRAVEARFYIDSAAMLAALGAEP
jgi:uncharacterized protein